MQVKIGNAIFDSSIEPVMLILEDDEKRCIANMGDQERICFFDGDQLQVKIDGITYLSNSTNIVLVSR